MKQYIYEIINNLNGKTYVGQRKCHCEIDQDPYFGSGIIINQAIILFIRSEKNTKVY